MTTTASRPIIILIAGHWLGAWAWDEVLEHLATDQSRAVAMTLPGLDGDDPGRAAKTLDDQAAAVLDVISQLGPPGAGQYPAAAGPGGGTHRGGLAPCGGPRSGGAGPGGVHVRIQPNGRRP